MSQIAFVAYPGGNQLIKDAISGAMELSANSELRLTPWEKMGVIGLKIDDLIREKILEADVLIADITIPNFNVFYEIGYAAAVGKPVIPIVNLAFDRAVRDIQQLGLFDTIGWAPYNNANELSDNLQDWNSTAWKSQYSRRRDYAQPLFILDTLKKTDFRNHIFHAVDNSHVHYRTFAPDEIPRLTAAQALAEVSASAGVIVPIISAQLVDNQRHNLRAAFVLGLSHGFGIEPLAIQYENAPAPLDYRDFIRNSTFRRETEKHVEEYCAQTLVRNQTVSKHQRGRASLLTKIDLGSPAAENEMQQLEHYFIRTAEYARAVRAEGAVVVGRKGSGKSAVFFQVAADAARDKHTCVVDLRPASHNLSEMRQALISVLTAGVFDHTIAAFWQYIIYVEILLKMRERLLPLSRNDALLQQRIREVEESFSLTDDIVAGDFTSRLENAVKEVVGFLKSNPDPADLRSHLTNIMFERPIPKLRDALISFRDYFDQVFILIDDLDKGWPPRRVEEHDVATIKHLIEVLNRVQRDVIRRRLDFRHLIFLRSDIYERLVEQTSDRGKYNPIKVDWSDPEQLIHLLRQRVFSAVDKEDEDAVWQAFNPIISGREAVDLLVDSSLRRPRFLIDLCERILSFAINRGHDRVSQADVEEGMRQMSLYLVSDFGYELRDVAGTPEEIFYAFIGQSELLTEAEIEKLLLSDQWTLSLTETIDLFLWYGFLGIVGPDNRPIFIYDRAYDFRRLEAERSSNRSEVLYAVNPAFLLGLQRS